MAEFDRVCIRNLGHNALAKILVVFGNDREIPSVNMGLQNFAVGKAEEKQSYMVFSVVTIAHSPSFQGNPNTSTRVPAWEASLPFAPGTVFRPKKTLSRKYARAYLIYLEIVRMKLTRMTRVYM